MSTSHSPSKRSLQLRQRVLEPELMDDPSLGHVEHEQALRGLARIHWSTFTASRLWKVIRSRLAAGNSTEFSLLDVGCSDGWLSCEIAKLARNQGYHIRLVGCDFSDRALNLFADRARRDHLDIELERVDILQGDLPRKADVVLNSLFLHHFQDDQVVTILPKLASAAGRLLLIDDLLRSRLGYLYCQFGVRLLSRSRVVHIDGPLSVLAAFSLEEIRELLVRSGLPGASVSKHWPERYLIEWSPA